MSDVSTYGFNNNARRRIKCNYCERITVVRVANLITHSELTNFCHEYLKNYTRDFSIVESITDVLLYNFTLLKTSKDFDRLMARQSVLTYSVKEHIMKAFIGIEIMRTKINKWKSYDDFYDTMMSALDFKNQMDNEGYLKVSKGVFYSWVPKHIDDLLQIEYTKSEEEYKFEDVVYEMAAHLHDEEVFYDWKSRSLFIFDEIKNDKIPVREQ